MEQYFTHYKNWEDWQNGMWKLTPKDKDEILINLATECLRDPREAMESVIIKWPESTKVNLTNNSSNKKSWLGQAACCIAFSVPETLTRSAWNNLTDDEKLNANAIAKEIIDTWVSAY